MVTRSLRVPDDQNPIISNKFSSVVWTCLLLTIALVSWGVRDRGNKNFIVSFEDGDEIIVKKNSPNS